MKKAKTGLLLLVVVLCVSMLVTGCGNSTGGNASTETTAVKETSAAAQTEPPASTRTEPVKITVSQISWGTQLPAQDADFVRNAIKDAIKVDVELQNVDGFDEYVNQTNVKIASGSTADIFGIVDRPTFLQYQKNGVLLEVTPYLDKLQAYVSLVGEEFTKKTYIGDKSYALTKAPNVNYHSLWIRQDWLDKLGLSAPTNADEYFTVAKAFTENDPDGNGKKDTYGITSTKGAWMSPLQKSICDGAEFDIMVKDGKLFMPFMSPKFKEFVEIARKFVAAGVVDPEYIVNAEGATKDKLYQGKAGMTYCDWSQLVKQDAIDKIKAVNPNAKWVQVAPFKNYEGKQVIGNIDLGLGSYWGLSPELAKSPEKLQAVLDFIDFISTPDGNKLVSFGVKDTHWAEKDGKVTMTDQGKKECGYTWLYQITGRKEMEYLITKFADQAPYIEYAASKFPTNTIYNGLVDKPEGYLAADAASFMGEQMTQVYFGKLGVDEFDKAIETLKSKYGLDLYVQEAERKLKELGYIQ